MNVSIENIMQEVRNILPNRALTLGEALQLAERQAKKLHQLLDIRDAPIDVFKIDDLPQVSVLVKPRYQMSDLAGFTQCIGPKSFITINQNDSPGRRRFTLAHEFKHVLDDRLTDTIYAQLGYGDDETRHRAIERICDHFAACLLMPKAVVKKAWLSGMQDVDSLAHGLFNVSTAAMRVRLNFLGLSDHEPRPVREYFRSSMPRLPKPALAASPLDWTTPWAETKVAGLCGRTG